MKFTNQTEYAIRIMMAIAKHDQISVSRLAEEEGIPRPFASRIAFHLKQAGLIAAHRGASGGVFLAKKPQAITVLDIIRAVEGQWSVFSCVDNPESCGRSSDCPLCGLWFQTQTEMEKVLKNTTLDILLKSGTKDLAVTGS